MSGIVSEYFMTATMLPAEHSLCPGLVGLHTESQRNKRYSLGLFASFLTPKFHFQNLVWLQARTIRKRDEKTQQRRGWLFVFREPVAITAINVYVHSVLGL